MKYVKKKLSDLKPYENNPRINDEAVDDVAESIKQCSYIAPIIIDEDGVILAGHTRYKALKKLGYKECEVVIASNLSEEQKKKYRLYDNKTAEMASWDQKKLSAELCDVDFLPLYSIDSTNMEPRHWLGMAKAIKDNYESYDGFVILHGTDTMSYTGAALSYLIQNSAKPVVITGSQRPVSMEITDAKHNIYDSFLYACDDESHNISIVFDGHVIAGTRARKIRTKSFNAFESIDFPDIAVIRNEQIVRYIRDPKPDASEVKFYDSLNKNIFVLKLTPGMDPGVISYIKANYDALIIESFGVGGIPCYEIDSFIDALADFIESGRILALTTQVPHEGSDMSIYKVGVRIKEKYEVLEAYDMTMEACLTKLMWISEMTDDHSEMRKLFYKPVNHDII